MKEVLKLCEDYIVQCVADEETVRRIEASLRKVRGWAEPKFYNHIDMILAYLETAVGHINRGFCVELCKSIHSSLASLYREMCIDETKPPPRQVPPQDRRLWVTAFSIHGYSRRVEDVPVSFYLGRCDPPREDSGEPSYLCLRDEAGRVLQVFREFECLWGCPRPDSPDGCCHREHVKIEVGRHSLRLVAVGKYPFYLCGSGFREVRELEVRAGESVSISIAGLRRSASGDRATEVGGRVTEVRPCVEVAVV